MKENLLPAEQESSEILVKKLSSTNQDYGFIPEKRPIQQIIDYGIVNINKPSGPTSHQISDYTKKILNIDKSGHSGTLDPKVTGVLPIALSKATRIVQTLLPSGKEYIAIMRLHSSITETKIKEVFKKFTGEIQQLPPVRSAVKRRLRPRTIYYSEILEIKDNYVLFKVGCEAGTYIRKLIHDIGRSLNTGAHMVQLIRTKVPPFTDKNWHTLQDLKDAYETYKETKDEKLLRKIIQPFEVATINMKKIWVFDSAISNICHGSPLAIQGISKLHNNIHPKDTVAIMTLKDELICLSKAITSSKEMFNNEKGLATKTECVFMDRNTYPKQNENSTNN
jgi:H/ACA ribonucleoprotein complex subunit 4